MATAEEVKLLLEAAKNKERMAEKNCEAILQSLKVNGFHDQIERIKNDEARHRMMVEQLLKFLV